MQRAMVRQPSERWGRFSHRKCADRRPPAAAPIFEANFGFDILRCFSGIQCLNQGGVFLGDETAANLAGTCQFIVIGIELLVQHTRNR